MLWRPVILVFVLASKYYQKENTVETCCYNASVVTYFYPSSTNGYSRAKGITLTTI